MVEINLKQKQEYIDFVFEEIIDKDTIENITNIFISLKITTVYFMREIKQKSDCSLEFIVPKSTDEIIFKKAYLIYDLSLLPNLLQKINDSNKPLILCYGGDIKQNASLLEKNRGVDILLNPISNKLAFDTASSNLAKANNITIGFDLNLFREKPYLSIKQARFIIFLLLKDKVEMKFLSCARKIDELIDLEITKSLLFNFKLEKETINRLLTDGEK